MDVLVFVLIWATLAIGLILLGLRSGRRGKQADVNVSRGGRAHWYIIFTIILVLFGVGLPIVASAGVENDADRVPVADINALTDAQEHGRELFGTYCSQCHTLAAANAVAQVGPNLDVLRPTEGLVKDAVENGRARGNGAMARNLVTGEDLDDVASFVAKAVGQDQAPAEPAQ
jgi:mono/diheme cytochrome c family protein